MAFLICSKFCEVIEGVGLMTIKLSSTTSTELIQRSMPCYIPSKHSLPFCCLFLTRVRQAEHLLVLFADANLSAMRDLCLLRILYHFLKTLTLVCICPCCSESFLAISFQTLFLSSNVNVVLRALNKLDFQHKLNLL